jgi:hypothetical protein
LPDQVDKIKQKQEELGQVSGLIDGMEEYFKASFTGWDTYEDTLRRVKGQLTETLNLFKLELGEPIKIALVEQLAGIRDWIAENEDAIRLFFKEIGDAVATVVTGIGEVINSALESIDVEDLEEVSGKVKEIADNIKNFTDSLLDADFSTILDGLMLALDIVDRLITETQNWLTLLRAGAAALEVDEVSDLEDIARSTLAGGPLGFLQNVGGRAVRSLIKEGTGQPSGLDEAQAIIDARKEQIAQLEKQRLEYEKLREARKKADEEGVEGAQEEGDALFKLNAITRERRELLDKVAEAVEEINAEIAEFNVEMERAFRDIFVEEGRRQLDMRIENAQKRLDMERKHGLALRDIFTKRQEARLDEGTRVDREEEDDLIAFNRKLEDIEIQESRKKEENLEKHLNRLKEIREKFDLDAEEAIRMNDAVALLRIRRRMELELRQEERKLEQSNKKAEDAAEDKREDVDKWLRREEEDLARSNTRKLADIKKRHDREVEAEKQKYADQLAQQEIEEQRKRDELQKWLDREVEDYNQMWVDKNEDLTNQMADAIDIYESGINRIIEINAEIASLMAQGLVEAGAYLENLSTLIPSIIGGEAFGLGESDFGIGSRLPGENPNQANLQQLQSLARSLAQQLGRLDELSGIIADSTYDELTRIIVGLQDDVRRLGPGRQHGGMVNPNMALPNVAGELGPEPIFPMQHGIVAPHDPFMMSPQSQGYTNISTDNSRNVSADISMLDPTALSEVQKTLIRSIFTEELLRLGE